MRLEDLLKKADQIDPRMPYWIEKLTELAGGTNSVEHILLVASKLLAESEQRIDDFDRHSF